MKYILYIVLLVSFFAFQTASAQKVDSSSASFDTLNTTQKLHSPRKATLYSMALPGLGQAYNKKYWKVPLVYIGIGIPMFYALRENSDFKDYRKAYRARLAGDTNAKFQNISEDNLLTLIDIKRRNRDLLYIVSSLIYVLNAVDAAVDAHFFYFNVSDDLSLRVEPKISSPYLSNSYSAGVQLSLTF